jgi:hypothetical protein
LEHDHLAHAGDGSSNPAILLAAANSFVAETAVKLERLDQRAATIEAAIRGAEEKRVHETDALRGRLFDLARGQELLDAEFKSVQAQVGRLLGKQDRLVTDASLRSVLQAANEECAHRHELSMSRSTASEEDYERLRLRIEHLENRSKPKWDLSWTYGAIMFSLGIVAAVVGLRFPF